MTDTGHYSRNGFLTRRGYELARAMGIDKAEVSRYLDKVGSVSALVEGEGALWPCDSYLEEQHRRFLNGS